MPERLFSKAKFDVEHALSMYATSFVVMPAECLYDDELVELLKANTENCHIYIIGQLPKVDWIGCAEEGGDLILTCEVHAKAYVLKWPMPTGSTLQGNASQGWAVVGPDGRRSFPSPDLMLRRLNEEHNALPFEVLYVGQAYGADGSRNALDRLQKHETLQKIAIKSVSEANRLMLLLLEITSNRMLTVFNPWAQDRTQSSARISQGLDKLFGTSEAERVSLFEAALVRYFQPAYNKIFKDSFPSTNMKLLADCYAKDFNALVAEVCIDEIPFKMFSATVRADQYHTAFYDLHADPDRKVFFFGTPTQ